MEILGYVVDATTGKEILCLLMFATTCVFLLAGFPAAFTLAGSAFLFALLGTALGLFDFSILGAFPQRI